MKEALVIIDIQMDYFQKDAMFFLESGDRAAAAARELLACFRKRDMPVFHIKHENPAGRGFMEEGTAGTAFHPSVQPTENETIVRKRWPNAFFETNLSKELKARQIEKLTIIGFMANMCVDATVRSAREHGFAVDIVPEAVAACPIGDLTAEQVKTAFVGALTGLVATGVPLNEKLSNL